MNESADPGRPSPPSGSLYRLAWIFYLVLAAIGLIWLGFQRGRLSLGLFLDPASWWLDLLIGAATGALLAGLWWLAERTLPLARSLNQELRRLLGLIDSQEALALALISGVAEEVLFRGAMLQAWGWIVATVLFGLLHLGGGKAFRLWAAFALIAGLALAGLVLWRGNLLPAIVAHVTVNAMGLLRLRD